MVLIFPFAGAVVYLLIGESRLGRRRGRRAAALRQSYRGWDKAHPKGEAAAQEQARAWCGLMKEEGGALLAAVLREWAWPPRRPGLAEKVEEVAGYIERQAHRMEYPEYLARGWCIGSGAVESACHTVVGQRLKLAGMRWGEDGADALCHLRALYRSEKGQWEAFWNRAYTPN